MSDYSPSGFFVLRAPLYAFDRYAEWVRAASETAESNLERRRRELRGVFDRPEAREALLLASPSLVERLALYDREPTGDRGRKVELALLRYFVRMATRCTPFGLFAGCTLGAVGAETGLELSSIERAVRRTRLDMHYICALVEAIQQDEALRRELRYHPNSSLYRMYDRFHYAQWRPSDNGRTYELVVVEASEYLEATLERAVGGETAVALAEALVRADDEIDREEAEAYINELIDSQILVAEIEPRLTGEEPLAKLIEHLQSYAAGRSTAEVLRDARTRLARLDEQPPGVAPQAYHDVSERLTTLPAEVDFSRLFQVDLFRRAESMTLGPKVTQEILRGVEALHRLARGEYEPLTRFVEAFRNRYEEREVPLVEALDEEAGIGFDTPETVLADVSPLLAGLEFPAREATTRVAWGPRDAYLLACLTKIHRSGASELRLDDGDLKALSVSDPLPAPDAFAAMVRIEAESAEAVDRGDFRVLLELAAGPSGATMLGRFCHGDAELERAIRRHLADEEAHRPDAVFAEIVHLSEGRLGNVMLRPVLRRCEIPYQGVSGAPVDCRIPISDLLISIVGDRIVLRSRRLGREVIPRLTNAHNFNRRSLGIYRFLCSLQSQGVASGIAWRWGVLENAPMLPRVSWGRIVFSRARWRLSRREIEKLTRIEASARPERIAAWRAEFGIPRHVVLSEVDNELFIDLEDPLSVDMFLGELSGSAGALLTEPFPAPGCSPVRGTDGQYGNEFLIPFVRTVRAAPSSAAPPMPTRAGNSVPRTFAPGGDWLYAKLYTGYAMTDRVLSEAVRPLVDELLSSGASDGWFFLRFGDPEWHLRLRLHGDSGRFRAVCLPRLEAAVAEMLAAGRIRRMTIDTYDREMERYGGSHGIELAEELFYHDSEAALAIVESLEGDAAADARWRLALRGVHLLLEDFGFDLERRRTLMKQISEGFLREFAADAAFRRRLAALFRERRADVEALIDPSWSEGDPLAPGFEILARRSPGVRSVASRLEQASGAGRLGRSMEDLVASFAHMHVNRVLRSAHRAQEAVIYFLLQRTYESMMSRTLSGTARRDAEET